MTNVKGWSAILQCSDIVLCPSYQSTTATKLLLVNNIILPHTVKFAFAFLKTVQSKNLSGGNTRNTGVFSDCATQQLHITWWRTDYAMFLKVL